MRTGGASPNAIPAPLWCADHPNGGIYGTRTEACEGYTGDLTTTRIINGVSTLTGEVFMDIFSYAYTSETLGTWAHQMQVSSYSGWGDALKASVQGSASASGACTIRGSTTFPPQPVLPFGTVRSGDGFFDTTATAQGAVGHCTTGWTLTFTNPGFSTGSFPPRYMSDVRCDNATGGNPSVGCVMPWYASAILYSQSSYPALASHVARAQASGLPGATFTAPLIKDSTLQASNRQRACGDAPSIPGLSCDEYPIASSRNGLNAGGTRRTFDGCNFNLPRATGPTGVSVCMIAAGEQNAQGGLNSQLFRHDRVLEGDPIRILVVA
ncbi:MAG: hypothetical protein V7603_1420 [Micromonosporaceae bacterium]